MDTNAHIALLFPGQGSQSVGMGREFYEAYPVARAVFDEADAVLGFSLSKLIFAGPAETLQLTEHTQPAILTVSIAAWRVLQELVPGLVPAFAAGHSLGSTRRTWQRVRSHLLRRWRPCGCAADSCRRRCPKVRGPWLRSSAWRRSR